MKSETAGLSGARAWWMQSQGALAYVLPRASAERLVADPPGKGTRTRTDHWMGRHCINAGLRYLTFCPSLVRHTGEVSSLSTGTELAGMCPAEWRQASVVATSLDGIPCEMAPVA